MALDKDENDGPGKRKEMFDEISALIGGIAKAFDLEEKVAISAVEQGNIQMTFDIDANGNRFVLATYDDKSARLYAGAIKQEEGKEH